MMVMRRLLLVLGLLLPALVGAADVPALKSRVTDLTATLSAEQRAQLEQRLAAFEQQKGSQIAVLLVPTTQPDTIEQYGIRVTDAWKLGRDGIDDGALLLIATQDRALRIEVGYGLEGVLPDAVAKRIIEETITPKLREGDWYGGIQAGVEQMIGVVSGEALPPPQAPRGSADSEGLIPIVIFAALFAGQILRAMFGRLPGALIGGIGVAALVWLFVQSLLPAALSGLAVFAVVLIGLGSGRGGIGGGGFGRSGGFGGGGGFSGGGGGFGGGGASGRF